MTTPVYTIEESNKIFTDLITHSLDKPFFIARLAGDATNVSLALLQKRTPSTIDLKHLQTNAGIYCNNESDIELYAKVHNNAILASTHLACFPSLCTYTQHEYLRMKGQNKGLHNRALEPFYMIQSGSSDIPWTHALKVKKVLIINPFVESFKRQMDRGFTFFNTTEQSKQIFLPGQEFVYYRSYNTLAGNRLHKNWFETFSIMCKDIKALDFDIALLGCGGYGLPLCNFINKMGKSAIYIGGALQLLFGVSGNRWTSHDIIGNVSKLPGNLWTRPIDEEKVSGGNTVEGACYW